MRKEKCAHPDDALVRVVGVCDDIDSEEGVDAVLGVKPSQYHPEVPRIDGETPQHSPST